MQKRVLFEKRQGAELALMNDPARLLIEALVVFLGIPLRDVAQAAAQHRRSEQARLKPGHQDISAEQRQIFRHACGRGQPLFALAFEQRQRSEVRDGAIPRVLHLIVAGAYLRAAVERQVNWGIAKPVRAVLQGDRFAAEDWHDIDAEAHRLLRLQSQVQGHGALVLSHILRARKPDLGSVR